MKTVLKKSTSYYNPMHINGITFERIYIVDGDKTLHTLKWFTSSMNNSNATDEGIYFHGVELKRSKLTKNKLRYQGNKGNYALYIDISIMPIEQVAVKEDHYDMNSYKNTYFRVQGLEAYFYDRDQLPQTDKQKAYEILYKKFDHESICISGLKESIKFYNENEDLCNSAGIKIK